MESPKRGCFVGVGWHAYAYQTAQTDSPVGQAYYILMYDFCEDTERETQAEEGYFFKSNRATFST